MGSCVSVHKDSGSAVKMRLVIGSKADKVVIPAPIKEKPVAGGDSKVSDVGVRSQSLPRKSVSSFRDFGSKEEAFFDSQPWLESDLEDDFFSVNGDFTPSRGNTPLHHSFGAGTPRINGVNLPERLPESLLETSPTDKKKRLSELFSDSLRSDGEFDEEDPTGDLRETAVTEMNIPKEESLTAIPNLPPKPTNAATPRANSQSSSGRTTPNNGLKRGERASKSAQCCLPNLLPSRSFSERKKRTSPARSFR